MGSQPRKPLNLPLLLTLGGMIILGITTTTLGFIFWPDPRPHHDVSTEGIPVDAGATPSDASGVAPSPDR